jgi:hypothetical protein
MRERRDDTVRQFPDYAALHPGYNFQGEVKRVWRAPRNDDEPE